MAKKTAQETARECQKSLDDLKALLEGKGKPFDPMEFFNKTFGFNEPVAADKRAAENYRRPA